MSDTNSNELLGYPPDARLLILNADDFGMYDEINDAVLATMSAGVTTSTSLMMPCPGAAGAIAILRNHPEIDFGVHLTVIRDLPDYRYGPLAPVAAVPSLVDSAGDFFTTEQTADFLARARLDELAIEFRAQIEAALASGIRPSHLDWHCLHNGGRADIFDLSFALAREYGLALRVAGDPFAATVRQRGLPVNDHNLLDSFRIATQGKAERYAHLLRDLPSGLTEWAVHPGRATPAAQALDDGCFVRQADYEFLTSPEARTLIRQEGIVLLSYRRIQEAWRAVRDA